MLVGPCLFSLIWGLLCYCLFMVYMEVCSVTTEHTHYPVGIRNGVFLLSILLAYVGRCLNTQFLAHTEGYS